MEHIQKDDIIIRKGILHILDSHTGYLGLSSQLLEMGPDLMESVRSVVPVDSLISLWVLTYLRVERVLYAYLLLSQIRKGKHSQESFLHYIMDLSLQILVQMLITSLQNMVWQT